MPALAPSAPPRPPGWVSEKEIQQKADTMGAIGRRPRRESAARFNTFIECKACQETWQGGDPALRVDCPRCAARPGEGCLWSGPHGLTTHIARDIAAMQAGQMTRCGALTWDGRHSRHLVLSCMAPPLTPAPVGQLALL